LNSWLNNPEKPGLNHKRDVSNSACNYSVDVVAGILNGEWNSKGRNRDGEPNGENKRAYTGKLQMKLRIKREALEKLNRHANEMALETGTATIQ